MKTTSQLFEPTPQGFVFVEFLVRLVLSYLFFSFIELTEGTQPSLIWENRKLFNQRGGSWLRLFNNTQLLRPKGDRATAFQRIFDLHNTKGFRKKKEKKKGSVLNFLFFFFLFFLLSPTLYCA
jgi:hypothetical protein